MILAGAGGRDYNDKSFPPIARRQIMSTRFEALLVLSGGDEFRQRLRVESILEQTVPLEAREFDFVRLRGDGLTAEQIAIAIGTPPILSPTRLVLIETAEQISRAALEALVQEIERAPDHRSLQVVLVYGPEHAPPRTILERAGMHEVIAPFKSPKAAAGWLAEYARLRHPGRGVSPQVLEQLVLFVGEADSGRLACELDKLIEMAGDRPLRPEDVALGVENQTSVKPYELYDAVGERRMGEAHRLLARLLQQPDYPGVRVIIGLAAYLAKLGHTRALLDEGENPARADTAFRGYFGERIVRQARGWRLREIDAALSALGHADMMIKTGAKDRHAMEWFLARIASLQHPQP